MARGLRGRPGTNPIKCNGIHLCHVHFKPSDWLEKCLRSQSECSIIFAEKVFEGSGPKCSKTIFLIGSGPGVDVINKFKSSIA